MNGKNIYEITGDIVNAMIEKGLISSKPAVESSDYNQTLAEEIGKIYKTVFKAVNQPDK